MTGQCNHCISKQAHVWRQYCHNSGAAGMGFGNPGQWLEARGLLRINGGFWKTLLVLWMERLSPHVKIKWKCCDLQYQRTLRCSIRLANLLQTQLSLLMSSFLSALPRYLLQAILQQILICSSRSLQLLVTLSSRPHHHIRQPRPHPLCALSW